MSVEEDTRLAELMALLFDADATIEALLSGQIDVETTETFIEEAIA